MAYISSQMGPVLQVMTMEARKQFFGAERSRLKQEIEEDSYGEGNGMGAGVRNSPWVDYL